MNSRYRSRLILGLSLCTGLWVIACSLFSGVSFPRQAAATPTMTPISIQGSTLSGLWTGTETLTVQGTCRLEQGDSVTNPVKMIWRVEAEGAVVVTLPEWPGVYPYTFEGQLQPDRSVSLELSTSAMCNGKQSPYSATYEGSIQTQGDMLILEMESTEVWCPGTCIFLRHYSVRKTGAEP